MGEQKYLLLNVPGEGGDMGGMRQCVQFLPIVMACNGTYIDEENHIAFTTLFSFKASFCLLY